MVPRQTHERKAIGIERIDCELIAFLSLTIFTFILASLCVLFGNKLLVDYYNPTTSSESSSEQEQESEDIFNTDDDGQDEEKTGTRLIDFQPLIDAWAADATGKKGVIIYDLDFNKSVGEYNADDYFLTASLYKLFVVYEGYRRLQNGTWGAEDPAGRTGHSIFECLDLAIRESNSACAETLWSMMGHGELNRIIADDFQIAIGKVENLSATPRQIMQIMRIYYEHTAIVDSLLVDRMKDSFLNQPVTAYNWRGGLPSGFSDVVKVYNKVGWEWDGKNWLIYNDAAIVDFYEQNRHYIVVVMTSKMSERKIIELGSSIENLFKNAY